MATSRANALNPIPNCLNAIQQKFYSIQNQICGSTDNKVYTLLIIGRTLQAAAVSFFFCSIAFTFVVGPVLLIAAISSIALGILGTYVAGNPEKLNNLLQVSRPFVHGQPVGLINSGNNCWLNSSLQLLVNTPSFHHRLRQIPEFSQFLDSYTAARNNHQKVAINIDTGAIRQFLSRATAGQITAGALQEDAAQFFEYFFQGPHATHQLEQQLNGVVLMNDEGAARLRNEPMIQIDLGTAPCPNFQQLFNDYFDYRSDIGQRMQLFFPRRPDQLLIQAKRFYQQMNAAGSLQLGKIVNPINAPERLTLPSHFVRTGEASEYVCDGFLIHHGANLDGGHYTSYIKVGSANTWWYCSDTAVYEVSSQEALGAMKNGLIFHYSRQ